MPTLLWFLPYYPPHFCAGAELSAHALNLYLVRQKGFRVVVGSGQVPTSSFQGVEISNLYRGAGLRTLVDEASLLVTDYEYAGLATYFARLCRKPLLHYVHGVNLREYLFSTGSSFPQYVLFSAHWVRRALAVRHPWIVVPPPVDWRHYQVETSHRYIALINVNENKGGGVLVELARRLPDKMFLGVTMSQGEQIVEPGIPNLAYQPAVPDVRQIYAQTHILLMPSRYEPWGRSGVEAMSSGIPVVANPTPGLRESLSYAGLFSDRENIDEWVRTLRALDRPDYYREVSAKCIQRSRQLDPAEDLRRFADFIDQILAS